MTTDSKLGYALYISIHDNKHYFTNNSRHIALKVCLERTPNFECIYS